MDKRPSEKKTMTIAVIIFVVVIFLFSVLIGRPRISRDEAIAVAQDHFFGHEVLDANLVVDAGSRVWLVEMGSHNIVFFDVTISARSGEIIRSFERAAPTSLEEAEETALTLTPGGIIKMAGGPFLLDERWIWRIDVGRNAEAFLFIIDLATGEITERGVIEAITTREEAVDAALALINGESTDAFLTWDTAYRGAFRVWQVEIDEHYYVWIDAVTGILRGQGVL